MEEVTANGGRWSGATLGPGQKLSVEQCLLRSLAIWAESQNLHDGKTEQTSSSCPIPSHVCLGTHTGTLAHTYKLCKDGTCLLHLECGLWEVKLSRHSSSCWADEFYWATQTEMYISTHGWVSSHWELWKQSLPGTPAADWGSSVSSSSQEPYLKQRNPRMKQRGSSRQLLKFLYWPDHNTFRVKWSHW